MRRLGSLWIPERFNIIRGGRTLEPKSAFPLRLGLSGHFTVELIDAATQKVKQRLEFDNLITDAGLNNMWVSSNISTVITWAAVGTDNTAPAVGQTGLGAEISPSATHRTNNDGGISDVNTHVGASFYWSRKKTYRFTEAQGNGNLTEIGLFSAQTGGTMWTRQLFKDGVGTPTTIVKTASDQLRVTYELRVHYPSVDIDSTFDLSGTTIEYIARVNDVDNANSWGNFLTSGNWNQWSGSIGGGGGQPGVHESNALVATTADKGNGTVPSSIAYSSYVAGDFFRDCTAIWEPESANFGTGIGACVFGWNGFQNNPRLWQVQFDQEQITKTNLKRLTLVARLSLARL